MTTIRTIAELRARLAAERGTGRTIALVPTMGALHAGHLSLIEHARATSDLVVTSLFVNPAQFNDAADLAAYPRDEQHDARLAEQAGTDVLFAPSVEEVYPAGTATSVRVRGPLTETLEGAHRGTAHFDGVTTVVAKLLNIVQPDVALFGQKDGQQALVVKQMVRDLELPVDIAVCPTIRDADGLALSSRNARLSTAQRAPALALSRALRDAVSAAQDDPRADPRALERRALDTMRNLGADPEYFAAVDPFTLAPATSLGRDVLFLTAATVGDVRLIDNLSFVPALAPGEIQDHPHDVEAATHA